MPPAEEDPARQVTLTAEQLAAVSGPSEQPPYLHATGSGDAVKAATHWVAADLASEVQCVSACCGATMQDSVAHSEVDDRLMIPWSCRPEWACRLDAYCDGASCWQSCGQSSSMCNNDTAAYRVEGSWCWQPWHSSGARWATPLHRGLPSCTTPPPPLQARPASCSAWCSRPRLCPAGVQSFQAHFAPSLEQISTAWQPMCNVLLLLGRRVGCSIAVVLLSLQLWLETIECLLPNRLPGGSAEAGRSGRCAGGSRRHGGNGSRNPKTSPVHGAGPSRGGWPQPEGAAAAACRGAGRRRRYPEAARSSGEVKQRRCLPIYGCLHECYAHVVYS